MPKKRVGAMTIRVKGSSKAVGKREVEAKQTLREHFAERRRKVQENETVLAEKLRLGQLVRLEGRREIFKVQTVQAGGGVVLVPAQGGPGAVAVDGNQKCHRVADRVARVD